MPMFCRIAIAYNDQIQTTTTPTMEHPETPTTRSTIVAAPPVALGMLLERVLYLLPLVQMAEAQFGFHRPSVVSGV